MCLWTFDGLLLCVPAGGNIQFDAQRRILVAFFLDKTGEQFHFENFLLYGRGRSRRLLRYEAEALVTSLACFSFQPWNLFRGFCR